NPGMGWLFAVALGLQQGRARAVLAALPPIAIGDAASLLTVAAALAAAGALLSPGALSLATALCLLGFGAYQLVRYHRHPRGVNPQHVGRSNQKIAPPPGGQASPTLPPCASTSVLTTASPSPVEREPTAPATPRPR